mgnify:CR=1 FL=1
MTHATLAFYAAVARVQLQIVLDETRPGNDRIDKALNAALKRIIKLETYHKAQAREILSHKRKARRRQNPKNWTGTGILRDAAWDAKHGFKKSLRKPAKYDFSKHAN